MILKYNSTLRLLMAWILIVSWQMFSGCRRLVEVNSPVTSTTDQNVYSSDATAIAAVTSIYVIMSQPGSFSTYNTGISYLAGLSADEFTLFGGVSDPSPNAYYKNRLSVKTGGYELWNTIYPVIFTVNSALDGTSKSRSLTAVVRQQLIGEAKFIRAFCYFYLVNLYGDVPLVTGVDYVSNAKLPRSPKEQIWNQITADLTDARNLLKDNYPDASLINNTTERVRPTKWAANALLARTYLYTQRWDSAEVYTSSVINNSATYGLEGLDKVFLSNSKEAIWQLQPVDANITNTLDAYLFIIPSTGPDSYFAPVSLSPFVLNDFEEGDQRRINWVGSVTVDTSTYYYPFKYKANGIGVPVTEYLMVLRLAEQYLIRAEARTQLNNLTGALSDLNMVRHRAGLPDTTASSKLEILKLIMHERKIELFTEWGHRWMDLKRTGNVDPVMTQVTPFKGAAWNTNQQLYPIPLNDLQRDQSLVQNTGY